MRILLPLPGIILTICVALLVGNALNLASAAAQKLPPSLDPGTLAATDSQQVGAFADPTDVPGGPEPAPLHRIDTAWLAETTAATGIPSRALAAYASAELSIGDENPACGIGWTTLAGIGHIESGHGSHGGAILGDDGWISPRILGPALDGNGTAVIGDTDGGTWDGDTLWDRAVGPLQFIPDTWARWGADGNGDGMADPNQIDDAALAAARYLCHSGPMSTTADWRAAVFSYNHLDSYVDDVATTANLYAQRATG
ncbi:lytic transglycosylase domain-containing protein [Okibacterium endophyticum]